ncbi:hypothetical protein [Corynebacterium comes]|uniref:Or membrane protein n=1 Tax=Corynebacterium comes TaxID=2675218 RepID=A0A6B8VV05_9CORY|nr:hypothetical protein [Corynebacterium comes]QGU03517.1 hypothetical protein CETAM_01120 [Corynebacterium comes]
MHKFRRAAIAAATVVSVSLAGTGVAVADDSSLSFPTSSELGYERDAYSIEDGKAVIADENQITGQDGFGEVQAKDQPAWFTDWKDAVATLGLTTLLGAVIGLVNWLKFQGILPY